jgi:hypothetical protein
METKDVDDSLGNEDEEKKIPAGGHALPLPKYHLK